MLTLDHFSLSPPVLYQQIIRPKIGPNLVSLCGGEGEGQNGGCRKEMYRSLKTKDLADNLHDKHHSHLSQSHDWVFVSNTVELCWLWPFCHSGSEWTHTENGAIKSRS